VTATAAQARALIALRITLWWRRMVQGRQWVRIAVGGMAEVFRAKELLCRAETDWVYVDLARARPVRIPEDLRAAFPIEV